MSALRINDPVMALDYIKNELITTCSKHGVKMQFSRGRTYDRYAFANGVVAKIDAYGIAIERDSAPVNYFSPPIERYQEAIATVEDLLK